MPGIHPAFIQHAYGATSPISTNPARSRSHSLKHKPLHKVSHLWTIQQLERRVGNPLHTRSSRDESVVLQVNTLSNWACAADTPKLKGRAPGGVKGGRVLEGEGGQHALTTDLQCVCVRVCVRVCVCVCVCVKVGCA